MNRTRFLPLLALALSGAVSAGGGYVAPSAPAPRPVVAAPAPTSIPRPAPVYSTASSTLVIPALPLSGSNASGLSSSNASGTVQSGATSAGQLPDAGNVTLTDNNAGGLRSAHDAATADLTDPSGQVKGQVFLTQLAGDELLVSVQVAGLKPGMHGMHVHTAGECSDKVVDGKPTVFGAAGGHFDPAGTGNHAGPDVPSDQGHAGDLPMLNVGADGRGSAEFTTRKFSLRGERGILGRSLILHADSDDYRTNPAGNSGARVLCGVIESLDQ
ncbi:superoxide dismutase family protein [Deinococcus sp. Marseille-Q6407]|uniref:superoxide dismutase family protein n=1 Tax=Deinococcus sp. Marseille-Q6407 TaxID=2969223 RepID=UPI0021C1EB17|nr:superoxide dismutase family protein [Deinococcus sp. Marseille-Q6407]